MLISFLALDVLLFYVFFEAMLIPMYFLIGGFGTGSGEKRSSAAVKFLLYNLFGGLIMLAAVIGLYVVTARSGAGTFDFREIVAAVSSGQLGIDPMVMKALFLGFMFAFAIKAPLWPFHRWLPDAARRIDTGHCRADDGGGGQSRYIRHAPVLPAAVPGRLEVLCAADHHAGGHRHRVRRHRGDRPDRRDAPDRLYVDIALRLHHSRDLRDDQPGPSGLDALHGQPRHLDGSAVPGRRIPCLAPRNSRDRRLRRRAEGRPGDGGNVPGSRLGHGVTTRGWRRSSASSSF